jgi:hypothetical protein
LQHKTTQNVSPEQNQQDHNKKEGFLPLTELNVTTTQRRSAVLTVDKYYFLTINIA